MLLDVVDWRVWVDAHALTLYSICIVAAVVSAHAIRDGAGSWPHDRDANHRSRRALARALFILAIALSTFVGLAASVVQEGWTHPFDHDVQAALSAFDDRSSRAVALIVTRIGEPIVLAVFTGVVAIALVWRRQWRLALVGIACVAANGFLVRVLKTVFERARPASIQTLDQVSGWSFPSGHAAGTMMVCASAAWFAGRLLPRCWSFVVLIVMAAVIFAVGASRIVLGVHHTSDVLAGFALAAIHVALMIMLIESPWQRQGRPTWM